ncbi:MAG: diguanylate cyclase [Magnetococcus sp. WYHC-3]
MSPKHHIEEKLRALGRDFVGTLPGKVREVCLIWEEIGRGGWDAEHAERLYRQMHTLSGSAESFGLEELGRVSRHLTRLIKPVLGREQSPEDDWMQAVGRELREFNRICDEVCSRGRPPVCGEDAELASLLPGTEVEEGNRLVYLLHNDTQSVSELVLQLGWFRYDSRVMTSLAELREALGRERPGALITVGDLPPGEGLDQLPKLRAETRWQGPLVVLSQRDDQEARLAGVRAGSAGYFTRPFDVPGVLECLSRHLDEGTHERNRVFIIEDTPTLAQYYAEILRDAGMEVDLVTDPLQALTPLTEFQPDLILMDLYMPGCSGLEMARMLRQQGGFLHVPIVFLSAEADLSRQLAALNLGGDDFLTKPIRPEHLVISLNSRIQRARALRALMVRDSLTGLLNHTTISERLGQELERARRLKSQVAFVMLDIDFFKGVNDRYGHPVGDRVIKGLSLLLRQRLRSTDLVGRFGGEEFALIMLDTAAEEVQGIIDNLREVFSRMQHRGGEREFTVTFSGGVAAYPKYATATTLIEAADAALYRAKREGRNRILLAS